MALKTLSATATLDSAFTTRVQSGNHTIYVDQPKNSGGQDMGPSPLQLVMAAVVGCFGTIGRIIAHQEKITLRGMSFEIEADYDPDGLMGRNCDVRPGFQALRVKVDIDADLTREEKQQFLEKVERRCPLADNMLHGTSLHSSLV